MLLMRTQVIQIYYKNYYSIPSRFLINPSELANGLSCPQSYQDIFIYFIEIVYSFINNIVIFGHLNMGKIFGYDLR